MRSGRWMTASGRAPAHRGRVEDVQITGAAVDVVDDREEPALVVAVAVGGSHEDRLARRAPRTRVPGCDRITVEVELQQPDGGGIPARAARGGSPSPVPRAIAPGHLQCVAVPERRCFARRIDARVFDVALVDDCVRSMSVAHDSPALEDTQAPSDRSSGRYPPERPRRRRGRRAARPRAPHSSSKEHDGTCSCIGATPATAPPPLPWPSSRMPRAHVSPGRGQAGTTARPPVGRRAGQRPPSLRNRVPIRTAPRRCRRRPASASSATR